MSTQAISRHQPRESFDNPSRPLSPARLGGAKPLGAFPLFEGLEPEALHDLEAFAQTRVLEKGQTVFFPDDRPGSVFFVGSGRVKISRLSVEGKEFILDLIEPGQVFGETGIFDDGPREASAETMERSSVVSVSSERLRSFLAQKPAILMRFTAMLGSRQKGMEKRLLDVAHKGAPRRLAELLLQLSQRYGVRDRRGTLLRIKLSQSAFGNLLGVSREIVNHAISDMRRQGMIDVADGRVIIQNPEALALAAL